MIAVAIVAIEVVVIAIAVEMAAFPSSHPRIFCPPLYDSIAVQNHSSRLLRS